MGHELAGLPFLLMEDEDNEWILQKRQRRGSRRRKRKAEKHGIACSIEERMSTNKYVPMPHPAMRSVISKNEGKPLRTVLRDSFSTAAV